MCYPVTSCWRGYFFHILPHSLPRMGFLLLSKKNMFATANKKNTWSGTVVGAALFFLGGSLFSLEMNITGYFALFSELRRTSPSSTKVLQWRVFPGWMKPRYERPWSRRRPSNVGKIQGAIVLGDVGTGWQPYLPKKISGTSNLGNL